MAGPITSYVTFPFEAESKSAFKLKVNNLQIQKASTRTAKAFAVYASDVKQTVSHSPEPRHTTKLHSKTFHPAQKSTLCKTQSPLWRFKGWSLSWN